MHFRRGHLSDSCSIMLARSPFPIIRKLLVRKVGHSTEVSSVIRLVLKLSWWDAKQSHNAKAVTLLGGLRGAGAQRLNAAAAAAELLPKMRARHKQQVMREQLHRVVQATQMRGSFQ